MDFMTKLNLLFKKLMFTNAKVARCGGLDASLISRFRTGARIPTTGSRQVKALCQGLVCLAEKEGKLEFLCACCGISCCNNSLLFDELEQWLSVGDMGLKAKRQGKESAGEAVSKVELAAFSSKLNALMNAFEITNIRLAKALHIDASLISRFRTGMRSPASGSWFPEQFCTWMAERIFVFPAGARRERLIPLIGEPIPETPQLLKNSLLTWMYSEPESSDSQILNRFLARLETCQPVLEVPAGLMESIRVMPAHAKNEAFFGIEGLRKSVKRFLTAAAVQTEPSTLFLYSDQPLNWLTGDPDFARDWAVLMSVILHHRNRICIIHNIDRSFNEMFEALEKWIPLYMTGLIQSFYCEKKQESRFHQTMFILPQVCSVNAAFVAGTEDTAEYLLTTRQAQIDYHHQQFQALLQEGRPLLKALTLNHLNDYYSCMEAIPLCTAASRHLLSTLSIGTMPAELFEQIMLRSMYSDNDKMLARAYRQNALSRFELSISNGGVTELVPMPSDEMLFAQRVQIDLPARNLYYTEEEFTQHMQYIIHLIKTRSCYRFYPLPESPFENVVISIWGIEQSLVVKTDSPVTIFVFENMLMNESFSKYLETIAQTIMPGAYRQENAIAQLLKYIG